MPLPEVRLRTLVTPGLEVRRGRRRLLPGRLGRRRAAGQFKLTATDAERNKLDLATPSWIDSTKGSDPATRSRGEGL